MVRSANGTYFERLLADADNDTLILMPETVETMAIDDVFVVGPYNSATVGGA